MVLNNLRDQLLNRVIEEKCLVRGILRLVVVTQDDTLSHAVHDQLLGVE